MPVFLFTRSSFFNFEETPAVVPGIAYIPVSDRQLYCTTALLT